MIFNRHGVIRIKREVTPQPTSYVRIRKKLSSSRIIANYGGFQRLERVEVEVSKYNRNPGGLDL